MREYTTYIKRLRSTVKRGERMRERRLDLPFRDFAVLVPFMTGDTVEAVGGIAPPPKIAGRAVPQDLHMATFGTLVRLQGVAGDDYTATCCSLVEVLTGVPAVEVSRRPARQVLGLVNMVQREMGRIGKLFQSLQGDKSSDDVAAGIDRLNFGAFGIVDWYARRMGIIDHEDVFATPWQRIYQCMKIDYENIEFNRRLRIIAERRKK